MFHLQRNLPAWERALRLGLGALIAMGAFFLLPSATLQMLGFVVAATLASTAAVGFCPACAMLGRRPVGPSK